MDNVPNVPCGVESLIEGGFPLPIQGEEFLMYRVELKAFFQASCLHLLRFVPNVPCGVESSEWVNAHGLKTLSAFLMYRVELKEAQGRSGISPPLGSCS